MGAIADSWPQKSSPNSLLGGVSWDHHKKEQEFKKGKKNIIDVCVYMYTYNIIYIYIYTYLRRGGTKASACFLTRAGARETPPHPYGMAQT